MHRPKTVNVYDHENDMLLAVGDFTHLKGDEPLCGPNWDSDCDATQHIEEDGEKHMSMLKVNFPPTLVPWLRVEVLGSMDEDYAVWDGVVLF